MDKHENNLPTGLELVNALDGVSKQRLEEIIAELRNAAANDDDGSSDTKHADKHETKTKEPVLEI